MQHTYEMQKLGVVIILQMTQKPQGASLLQGLDSEQQGWPSNRVSSCSGLKEKRKQVDGEVEKARFLDEMSLCGISNSERRPAVTLCWPRWRWDRP